MPGGVYPLRSAGGETDAKSGGVDIFTACRKTKATSISDDSAAPPVEAGANFQVCREDLATCVSGGISFSALILTIPPPALIDTLKTTMPSAVVSSGYCTFLAVRRPAGTKGFFSWAAASCRFTESAGRPWE